MKSLSQVHLDLNIQIQVIFEHFIFKDPKTDNGVKKSAKGMVKVVLTEQGYELVDKLKSTDDFSDDEMKVVFKDGTAYSTSFESVLDRANNSL